MRLPAGAGKRRLADLRVQLAARRAPQAVIRFLRPFEQQHFVALAETVEERGDFVREI